MHEQLLLKLELIVVIPSPYVMQTMMLSKIDSISNTKDAYSTRDRDILVGR